MPMRHVAVLARISVLSEMEAPREEPRPEVAYRGGGEGIQMGGQQRDAEAQGRVADGHSRDIR